MKLSAATEKWAGGILSVVAVALVVNLVWQLAGSPARASRPAGNSAALAAGSPDGQSRRDDELSRYDPVVHTDLLSELVSRSLPKMERDPFELPPPPAPPKPQAPEPQAQAPPPPPPPPPIKPMGYSEKAGGIHEAYVDDGEQVNIVHQGDTILKKYKVVKIDPASVTVEDETTHQSFQLPIPQ